MKEQFPEIKEISPVFYFFSESAYLRIKSEKSKNDIVIHHILSTNNAFFKLTNLKILISKTNTPFNELKSVVLPKSMALKLFGKINVIGEIINFSGREKLMVSAVVEDIPSHATFDADIFFNDADTSLGFGNSRDEKGILYHPRNIYLSLNSAHSIDDFLTKLNRNFPENNSNTKSVSAQSLRDIYFGKSFKFNSDKKGNKAMLLIFITIAIFTLIMAIFNYANFTISRQIQNFKASGIRITNGAQRYQIGQFYITDVALSVSISFALGLFISWLTMPLAENILSTELKPTWLLKPEFIGLILILLLIAITLSSILPIAFVNRLDVQSLFGKTQLKSKRHPLKRIMTITQLTISMILVTGLIVVNKQLNYVKTADIGFNKEHLLQINLPFRYAKKEVLKNNLSELPFIRSMSFTTHSPGAGWARCSAKNNLGEVIDVRTMNIDESFLETFGIRLLQGRDFLDGDMDKSCYISELAFKKLGWDSFVGKKLNGRNVIGVVNDININSLHTGIIPGGYFFTTKYVSSLNVKLKAGNVHQQLQTIEQIWNNVNNGETLNFQFYDDYFNSLYQKEERQSKALTLFAIIAFIITCMGLLSQVLQNTQNRIKEIGIRKINGATIKEVMLLLNKEFLWTVVIAFVIATPIAYYAMTKWLESFAYKTALSWWIFALAGVAALLIALLTVSWQSYRAASRNPVEALRYE